MGHLFCCGIAALPQTAALRGKDGGIRTAGENRNGGREEGMVTEE